MPTQSPSVLPYIRTMPLPAGAQELFSRAVSLMKQRPGEFATVGAWLDKHYSEATLRELCERKYRHDFAYRLCLLRRNSHTYRRRIALQRGRPLDEVKRERISEAHLRGERLEGTKLVGKAYPVDTVVDEANVHLVFAWEDEQYRRRYWQIKAERKYGERFHEIKAEPSYRRRFQRLETDQQETKLDKNDHPDNPGWRLTRAVREIIDVGYPSDAPAAHAEQSRKFVGLAALLVWPEPLPMLGELGRWWWESEFASVAGSAGWLEKALAVDPREAKAGPHPLLPTVLNPRSVGREEVLFHRMPGEARELQYQWGDLCRFGELLSVALDELEELIADPAPQSVNPSRGVGARTTEPPFLFDDLTQLRIRNDIYRRPMFYMAGAEHIRKLSDLDYEEELAEWNQHQQGSKPEVPRTPFKVLTNAIGPLDFGGMCTLEAAKAVLVLYWLLTDRDADNHPLGKPFGPWESDTMGRGMVRDALFDSNNEADDAAARSKWKRRILQAMRDFDVPTATSPPPTNHTLKVEQTRQLADVSAPQGSKKRKRSTERGEGRVKLIAALTRHHNYADGGCLNLQYIGNNELARKARVSESTASAFFEREFKGHEKYRALCLNAPTLVGALKLLNQDFSPHELYGSSPPRDDDRPRD